MDQEIVLALYGFFSGIHFLSATAVFFAQWFPYLLILFAAAWTFISYAFRGVFRSLLYVFAPATIAWFLVDAIKFFFPFPRPFMELGLTPLVLVSDPFGSFPSGHAAFFAALGLTIYLRDKKAGAWFLAGALLIGLARIATGVHYPLDILTGFLLGGVIAFTAHHILLKFLKGSPK